MAKRSVKKPLPTTTLSVVVWDDAHGSATRDVTVQELPHHPVVMKTVGWVLRNDEAGVSIANEVFYEDGVAYYRGHTFVPKAMIRSVTDFKLAKARLPVPASGSTDTPNSALDNPRHLD